MRKIIVVLTLTVVPVAFAPRAAVAEDADCTRDYAECLNDSHDLDGVLQTLADIECMADYTGCVARKVMKE